MKKTLKICILLFICLGILLMSSNVEAATSSSIAVDKSEITIGDTVTVTVKYTAAAWDLEVSADSGLTTSSTTHYADSTDSAENESKSFTVKYTASKAGTLYIYLKGDMTDESSNTADPVSQKVKVTVKEKTTTTDKNNTSNNNTTTNNSNANNSSSNSTSNNLNTTTTTTKSTNAYLKTLGVRISDNLATELGVDSNKYDFSGFKKDKTSYNVTVPKNVDSLRVFATAADSNATVKISGNSGFEVGTNNKITIKVTAEDGKTTKTYTIKVTKLAEEEEKPGNLIEDEKDLYLNKLSIDGIELSPEFDKDLYSYTATLTDADVNELKVEAEANIEDAKIDVSGNTDLVEGENTINILLTIEDSSVQKIYQIVVNKEVVTVITENNENNNESSTNDIIGMFKGCVGIAILVIVLMIVAVIVLIILLRKENQEEDEKIEEYESEEYNVYKNDENEFENNEISKDNFIESLYKQRNGNFDEEDLTNEEKETLEEISKQTEEIFAEKVEGQSVEYVSNDSFKGNPLEKRRKRRGRGKHSL